jgi:hypothetical protein
LAQRALGYGLPTYYLEEAAFVVGFGGRSTEYSNWDSTVWYQQGFWDSVSPGVWQSDTMVHLDYSGGVYYSGLDGVPDTLSRLGTFFKEALLPKLWVKSDGFRAALGCT